MLHQITIATYDTFFMHYNIEKELLPARLHYLEAMKNKPGTPRISQIVIKKVTEHITNGQVETYLGVESLFNYLIEKEPSDEENADMIAKELLAFMDQ